MLPDISQSFPIRLGLGIAMMIVIEAGQVPELGFGFGALRAASAFADGERLFVEILGKEIFVVRLVHVGDGGQDLCYIRALAAVRTLAYGQRALVKTLRIGKPSLV